MSRLLPCVARMTAWHCFGDSQAAEPVVDVGKVDGATALVEAEACTRG
jgi:hypothetical protein